MGKNIVLCADGTSNAGGYTPGFMAGEAQAGTLIVYHPDPRKKNCEDYRAKGKAEQSRKPFLNFPPASLSKPALLPAGKYIVLVQDALQGAKRASMICLARPLDIKPGSRLTLEVREQKDAKGPPPEPRRP